MLQPRPELQSPDYPSSGVVTGVHWNQEVPSLASLVTKGRRLPFKLYDKVLKMKGINPSHINQRNRLKIMAGD